MGMAVQLTRDEHSAAELRREAARCNDAAAARRMLALAMVEDGACRMDAARQCGMDRQTLRDWVHRYNGAGLPGLVVARQSGWLPATPLAGIIVASDCGWQVASGTPLIVAGERSALDLRATAVRRRLLSTFISKMVAWWTRRSMAATVIFGSPNI
jgi:hypothetical protein